jgi:heptaprenyl diphosphate synthase
MPSQPDFSVRRLTRAALLTAIALTIFMAEAQLPAPIPIPGVKLGLANIVTVYAMYILGPGDTLMILISRIFLGAVFSGQMMTLLYSLGGGLSCFAAMLILRCFLSKEQLWLASPLSAIFHNLGQILVAATVMRTWVVISYLPYLVLSGICSGLFTGLCTQFLIRRLNKI